MKAKERYEDAYEIFTALVSEETDRSKYSRKWASFVISVESAYSVLEQGAKASAKSNVWFDRVKHIRRTDPLLLWVRQARNTEHHGLAQSTARKDVKVSLIGAKLSPNRNPKKAEPRAEQIYDVKGRPVLNLDIRFFSLAPVKNRGVIYQTPKEHLGKPLTDNSPNAVAGLALSYLQQVLKEAEDFLAPCTKEH